MSLKVDFGMIVLNGGEFIDLCIENVYEIANKIIIVEGAVTSGENGKALNVNKYGLSIDDTEQKIRSVQDPDGKIIYKKIGFVKDKTELSNEYLKEVNADILWQLDSDEFYEKWVMNDILQYLEEHNEVNCIEFPTWNFIKDFKHVGGLSNWDSPWRRVFRYKNGSIWKSHAPPVLMWPNEIKSVDEIPTKLNRHFCKSKGWYLYHYSYVTREQCIEKMDNYYRKIYKPNWVGRVWDNIFNEEFIKVNGSHPYDETKLFRNSIYNVSQSLGRVDKFFRVHPDIIKNHKLYKLSYTKQNPLNIIHLVPSWCAGGGCRCPTVIASIQNEYYDDFHEFITLEFGVDYEFTGLNIINLMKEYGDIIKYIKNRNPDIIHIEWWGKFRDIFLKIRSEFHNIPFVNTVHVYPCFEEFKLNDEEIKQYDAFAFDSEKTLKVEKERCILYGKNLLTVINAPGDFEKYKLVKKTRHSNFNVLIGITMAEGKFRKDVFDILLAIVNKYEDIIIYCIGVTVANGVYEKMVKKINHPRIIFNGYSRDLSKLFSIMDLGLHILPDNSFAGSESYLQELMAARIPILKCGGNGIPENVIKHKINAYDAKDVGELIEYFDKLYNDIKIDESKLTKRIINTAYKDVSVELHPETASLKLRQFYLDIIEKFKNDKKD